MDIVTKSERIELVDIVTTSESRKLVDIVTTSGNRELVDIMTKRKNGIGTDMLSGVRVLKRKYNIQSSFLFGKLNIGTK